MPSNALFCLIFLFKFVILEANTNVDAGH